MYPRFSATSRTRCAQLELTRLGCFGRFNTRLAVVRLTPAAFATSDRLAIDVTPLPDGTLRRPSYPRRGKKDKEKPIDIRWLSSVRRHPVKVHFVRPKLVRKRPPAGRHVP